MLLMIDNYDSFTYNLVQYFYELGQEVEVHRNDLISIKDIEKKNLLIKKIGATQQHYCQQAEQLEKKLSSLDHELHDLLSDANLVVNTSLHSGVEIHIFDKVLKTTRNYPPCNINLQNNKVEINFKTH